MFSTARDSSRTPASAGVAQPQEPRRPGRWPAVHQTERLDHDDPVEPEREPVNAGRATTWTRWA